jgi:hypothetical protein
MKRLLLFVSIMMIATPMVWGQSRCLTPLFEQARIELYEKFGGSKGPSISHKDITIHEVGDTMTFWSLNLSVMPPTWELVPSTCRAVTEYSYVFVADDQWNVHMDSADVELVTYYWEEGTYNDSTMGIYELNTENFGLPPDELDDDDHIYILYDELGSYQGVIFDGYFLVYNEYTEEEAQQMGGHSNEVEMFYMSCHPGDPVSPIRISVLAHEFEHMIHWAADPDEDTWVDEGCAEYAMLLFGVPDPLVYFPDNPDNNLTQWDNDFADYIQTFMFITYIADHYGGSETIREIVQESQNSTYGIETAIQIAGYDVTFEEVFVDWTVANYYHGRGGADSPEPDSQYIYFSIDPPAFSNSDWHNEYPAGPNNRNVNHWAADYISFNNPHGIYGYLVIEFIGNVNADFGLGIVKSFTSGYFYAVRGFPVDSYWIGGFPDFAECNYITNMVAGLGGYATPSYSYNAETPTGIDDISKPDQEFSIGPLYPNPFNLSIQIRFSKLAGRNAEIEIFDICGRLVRKWDIPAIDNSGEIVWDGKNSKGEGIASGVYLFRISDDINSKIVKGTLLK